MTKKTTKRQPEPISETEALVLLVTEIALTIDDVQEAGESLDPKAILDTAREMLKEAHPSLFYGISDNMLMPLVTASISVCIAKVLSDAMTTTANE